MSEKPKGAVAILTRGDGVVMASASDFETTNYGGHTLTETQSMRARDLLANEMMRRLCHADIAEVTRGYDARQLMDALCRQKGYRVSVELIGHEEASEG